MSQAEGGKSMAVVAPDPDSPEGCAPTATVDDQRESTPSPPSRVSVIERFLEVRGIERKKTSPETAATATTTKPGSSTRGLASANVFARIPQREMWHAYTKRLHGERTAFARQAMRVPDESYSDSVDVYNPKKHPMVFIKIHAEADDVDRQFLYRARRLHFEREVVDRPVCGLMENQAWYDAALDRVYLDDDDSTPVESANPATASTSERT